MGFIFQNHSSMFILLLKKCLFSNIQVKVMLRVNMFILCLMPPALGASGAPSEQKAFLASVEESPAQRVHHGFAWLNMHPADDGQLSSIPFSSSS